MDFKNIDCLKGAKFFINEADIIAGKESFWINTDKIPFEKARDLIEFNREQEIDAAERLERFSLYIAKAFPETEIDGGIIESPLIDASLIQSEIERALGYQSVGRLMLKLDSELPISGSIKARGGIYEVLKYAEHLAMENDLLTHEDNYEKFASKELQAFFSDYSIVVGSTGNLGMSIGIMGASLGFKVTVHMSADARQWKKDLLRTKGVAVVEHVADYGHAVIEGREQAAQDPKCYFVDDEDSADLFLGYAVAARRLKKQLDAQGVQVDSEHPLFVYLPCGVGGGPGGVTFGLKLFFGDAVHCIFVEPTHAPAVLLGIATGLDEHVSAQDFGLDGLTAADGLAVSRPSGLVCRTMRPLIDGVVTVDDLRLYQYLAMAWDTQKVKLEPSAAAGFYGYCRATQKSEYLENHNLSNKMNNSTHIVWATGGRMVPDKDWLCYYENGRSL